MLCLPTRNVRSHTDNEKQIKQQHRKGNLDISKALASQYAVSPHVIDNQGSEKTKISHETQKNSSLATYTEPRLAAVKPPLERPGPDLKNSEHPVRKLL